MNVDILKDFLDLDTENIVDISDEKQIISGNKIRLNHTPFKNSLEIAGFTENLTGQDLDENEFYIDYSAGTGYRLATQFVYFGGSHDGEEIIANYKAVGSLILARDLNNIKALIADLYAEIEEIKFARKQGQMIFKGTVEYAEALPTSENARGDVWRIEKTSEDETELEGAFVVWDGYRWQILGTLSVTDASDGTKHLLLKFALSDGSDRNITQKNLREDLTTAEVQTVGNFVVKNNMLTNKSGARTTSFTGADLVETVTTPII